MSIRKYACKTAAALVLLAGIRFAQAFNISGTVIDSAGSQGIGGASVKLLEITGASTTTSASGAFSLTGTNAIPDRRRGRASIRVLLRGNRMMIYSTIRSKPVSVDVYASNGLRVFHALRATDDAGKLEVQGVGRAPGRYTVVMIFPDRTCMFTGLDIGDRNERWMDLRKSGSKKDHMGGSSSPRMPGSASIRFPPAASTLIRSP